MKLNVKCSSQSYPIILDENCARAFPAKLNSLFPESKFGLVTNTTILRLYTKQLQQWAKELPLTIHVMPDGERYKTVATWNGIFDTFLKAKFERSSVIIAFGGGVVGDMAGFAAATMLRGVRYVQVPTTLLAMVDSSVGGKTGVDHACGKNLIGAFHQPSLVWIDTGYLATLSKREYRSGYAELFKYAFIGGRPMFDFVNKHAARLLKRSTDEIREGIRRSIRIKASVVGQDEYETKGKRMLLNFGHTFGHALEKYFGFEKLLHGEAIWWGMSMACELGKRTGSIPARNVTAYGSLLRNLPRPSLPSTPRPADLYDAMFFDKKVSGGKLRFVVPAAAGHSVVMENISGKVVKEVIAEVLT